MVGVGHSLRLSGGKWPHARAHCLKAMCFSEDDDKLCATLQRGPYGTLSGYTAKSEAEELCW